MYKIERGTEYSQYKIEKYALAKKEMEVVANAYNKKQQFIEFAEGLRNDDTLSIDKKTQKFLEGFAAFYALSEDGGLTQLKDLIAESKLPISVDENGFDFGTLDDSAKNRALNFLLKFAQQSKEKDFKNFLGGKTIEEYQEALVQAHDEAIGGENAKMMAEAMKNDNLTCIQRWTGNTSMAGMGMTIVGGVLCFTPLAPLGAGMITVGNALAIGGMVAETGLGVADYATKEVQTAEEAEQLGKNFLMNAGGVIVGIGAGKAGMKAFNKLIDKKLVAVFGQQIAAGNKMQALKTVFTNPEYLKSFMTAAGAKLSADFVISYAGDLAMMGVLDTQDDWQSLLKANLTGILVGISGDIKDVSGVGRPRNFGVSDGVKGVNETGNFDQPTNPHVKKPMTEMDYGQRLLGNEVTVVDPRTGATVEGTVTGLHNTNGQVEIEVNGQRFSTNDVVSTRELSIKLTENVENSTQGAVEYARTTTTKQLISDISERINNIEEKFIPTNLQNSWKTCKIKLSNILKLINEGIIKFDKNTDALIKEIADDLSNIYNNLSGTIKEEVSLIRKNFSIIVEKAKTDLDPNNTYQNKIKILSQIKNDDGTLKFSQNEIEQFIKINENIPTKTLYSLLSLSSNDVSEILNKVKSYDDIKTLGLLLDIKNKEIENGNLKSIKKSEVEFDELYINEIFDIKQINGIEGFNEVLSKLLERKSFEGLELTGFKISNILYSVKTPEQKSMLLSVIDIVQKVLPNKYFDSWTIKKVLNCVRDKDDFKLFSQYINKYKDDITAQAQCCWTLAYQYADISNAMQQKRQIIKDTLGVLLAREDISAWNIDAIVRNLKSIDIDKFDCNAFNKYLTNDKTSVDDIVNLSSILNLDNNNPIRAYFNQYKKLPSDVNVLKDVVIDSDIKREAFLLLISEEKRFGVVAINDILSVISNKNDLMKLKTLIDDTTKNTKDIFDELCGNWEKKYVTTDINLSKYPSTIEELHSVYNIPKNLAIRIIQLKASSPHRYLKMAESGLFDLIKDGKLDPNILKNIDNNTFLSNRTLKDIKKIYNNAPNVKTLDNVEDLIHISDFVEDGDVCEFNGKLYANDNGNAVEINLSKDKYNELFPLLSSVSFEQNGVGNCYFVTTLDNFMDLPKGKIELLKLFEQKGNDILIKFPNTDKSILFPNGSPLDIKWYQRPFLDKMKKGIGSYNTQNTAPGISIIEQAYAVHRLREGEKAYSKNNNITDISQFTNVNKLIKRLDNGGHVLDVVTDIIGKRTTTCADDGSLNSTNDMKNLIMTTSNSKNTLTFFATKSKASRKESLLSKEYDLSSNHAYSIKGYNDKTGMVYITNPWHTSVVTEVPLYELLKYIDAVQTVEL